MTNRFTVCSGFSRDDLVVMKHSSEILKIRTRRVILYNEYSICWFIFLLNLIFQFIMYRGGWCFFFDLEDLETHRVWSGPDGRPSQSECLISYFWQALLRASSASSTSSRSSSCYSSLVCRTSTGECISLFVVYLLVFPYIPPFYSLCYIYSIANCV